MVIYKVILTCDMIIHNVKQCNPFCMKSSEATDLKLTDLQYMIPDCR